jgi:hypothetical protein
LRLSRTGQDCGFAALTRVLDAEATMTGAFFDRDPFVFFVIPWCPS